jgi:hypothetical protein
MPYNLPGSSYNDLYNKYTSPAMAKRPGSLNYQAPELAGLNQSSQAPAVPGSDISSLPLASALPASTATATPAPAATATATPASAGLPDYLQSMIDMMGKLGTPPALDVGLSSPEVQSILNVGKQNIQGATDTSVEAARSGLGLRGFNPGESGVADSALAGLLRTGSQNLTSYDTSNIQKAVSDRFNQQLAAQTAYQNQLGTMGNFGSILNQSNQFGQALTYQQQQDALNTLMNYYSQAAGSNAGAYSQYYGALSNAIG